VLLDRVPVGLTVAALCADCLMTYLGEVRDQLASMAMEVRHLREQAKETETLREALAAAEAVAEEVRRDDLAYLDGVAAHIGNGAWLLSPSMAYVGMANRPLPTPSAALQRVREEAVRQAVARADTKALESRWAALVRAMPYYSTEQGFADALRTVLLNALLPTPDPDQVFP
jgi:hypothetical protein